MGQRVRLPQNDMALFSTTGHLLVLHGVDEAVDALLVEVESLLSLIGQVIRVVHVYEAIE